MLFGLRDWWGTDLIVFFGAALLTGYIVSERLLGV
jgi:hypothetical protein